METNIEHKTQNKSVQETFNEVKIVLSDFVVRIPEATPIDSEYQKQIEDINKVLTKLDEILISIDNIVAINIEEKRENVYNGMSVIAVSNLSYSIDRLIDLQNELILGDGSNIEDLFEIIQTIEDTAVHLRGSLYDYKKGPLAQNNPLATESIKLNELLRKFDRLISRYRFYLEPEEITPQETVLPSQVLNGVAAAMQMQEENNQIQAGNNINVIGNENQEQQQEQEILEELNAEEQNRLIALSELIAVKGDIPPLTGEDLGIGLDLVGGIGIVKDIGIDVVKRALNKIGPMTRRKASLIVASGAVIGALPFISYAGYLAMGYVTYQLLSLDYTAPATKLWEYLGYNQNDIVIEEQESGSTTITNMELKQGAIVDKDGNVQYYNLAQDPNLPSGSDNNNGVFTWVTSSFSAMVGYLTEGAKKAIGFIWDNSSNIVSGLYNLATNSLYYGTKTTIALIGIGIAAIGLLYNIYRDKK